MLKLSALEITKQQNSKFLKHQSDVLDDVLSDVLEMKILELLEFDEKIKQGYQSGRCFYYYREIM